MSRGTAAAALLLLTAAAAASPAWAGPRPRPPLDSGRLAIALERLEVVGGALYIAAHPDDENTAFLAWLASGRKVRATYLALTRGEGGQNLIGSEQGPLAGVLRTTELIAAREVDGAEQRFSRAVDFGFSKSSAETLAVWDREAVLGDIVWAIRSLRPDVVVVRFPRVNPDTHGHHTASAILAGEAFLAAGDPARFPEQLATVGTWKPRRLFYNNWRPKLEGRTAEDPPLVTIDLGAYEPRLGRAFSELAAEARSMHKSQGFGSIERRGPQPNYFELLAGDALPPGATDLFAGINLSWSRLPGGAAVGEHIAAARAAFRPDDPATVVPSLLAAAEALDRLAPSPWRDGKRRELAEAVRAAAGLWLEAVAERAGVVPGSTLKVTTTALGRSRLSPVLERVEVSHATPPAPATLARPLAANAPLTDEWPVQVPADAPLSQPWWLAADGSTDRRAADDPALRGLPEGPPPLVARFTVAFPELSTARLSYELPVAYRWADPVEGERWRPIEILPAVAVALESPVLVFEHSRSEPIRVRLRSIGGPAEGQVRLELTGGFRAEPPSQPFQLTAADQETTADFLVTPPAGEARGQVRAVATTAAGRFDRGLTRIEYPHLPIQTLTPLAQARLVRVDLAGPPARVGYVTGAGDEVPEALRQAGYEVVLLDDGRLDNGDFTGLDAIVLGVRAFNTRPRLKQQKERLFAWVAAGGTLVVQYATTGGLLTDALGPWPFDLSRDRVTVEEAPVRLALADHPVLRYPNPIGPGDFSGWVQERGLYFAGKWDPRYEVPLAMADPGESDKQGALLVARTGKGAYIYTGLAFFRQLPAGVPGAYRLFANLLAAGRAPGVGGPAPAAPAP